MVGKLAGQVAIVTGASSGIGEATAHFASGGLSPIALAAAGVYIVSRKNSQAT